ncbi:unnamed protein product [Absidia cylindrospora]
MIGTANTISNDHANAGKLLNDLIERDHKHLDLSDLLTGSTSRQYSYPLIKNGQHFSNKDSISMPISLKPYSKTKKRLLHIKVFSLKLAVLG